MIPRRPRTAPRTKTMTTHEDGHFHFLCTPRALCRQAVRRSTSSKQIEEPEQGAISSGATLASRPRARAARIVKQKMHEKNRHDRLKGQRRGIVGACAQATESDVRKKKGDRKKNRMGDDGTIERASGADEAAGSRPSGRPNGPSLALSCAPPAPGPKEKGRRHYTRNPPNRTRRPRTTAERKPTSRGQ